MLYLFDVGNVIIRADHRVMRDQFTKLGVNSDNFFKEAYDEFSRGNLTGREFFKELNYPLSYEQVEKAHNDHLLDVDVEVVKLIPKNVVFLTNTNEWQTRREKELIDLTQYSKRIYRSDEIHFLKTDPGCFPYIINLLGKDLTLIDDSKENIAAAKKHGLRTHLFTNATNLAKFLRE